MNRASPVPLSDADYHAFVDGQLGSDRAERVVIAIASDPELAARVADLRRRNALLREALDPVLAEPIPARLLEAAGAPRKTMGAAPRK